MSVPSEVQLIRVRDDAIVQGWIVALTIKHLDDFSTLWRDRLRNSDDEDQYWDWEQKKRIYLTRNEGIYEGYAIECEQMTQGLMILQIKGHRSQVEPNRRIVYVHSLATAPWNRISTPGPNGFRAVGRAFLKLAQFRSEELGYGGLVGLHSLPSANEFYRKMGMIDGGADEEKENLTYFEWYRRRPTILENWEDNEDTDLNSEI